MFKVLSEDKKQLFIEMETEFERRQIGNISNILEWGAYPDKKLKTLDFADFFTKWIFFCRPKLFIDHDSINSINFKKFKDCLTNMNWKTTNKIYDRLFNLMWNSRSDNPIIFPLKKLNKQFFAMKFNPCCLTLQNQLQDLLEAYDIIDSNLINIQRIKYHMSCTIKEMIIAAFGSFLYFLHILRTIEWPKIY